jgi:hypothetical protein
MLNFGVLRDNWEIAFESPSVNQNFGSIQPAATNRSQEIPIPNLNADVIAIALHGTIILDAGKAVNAVTGAIITDQIDNFVIKDPEGKALIDLSWESFYNYCAMFLNEVFSNMTAMANFGGAGQKTFYYDIVTPVFIPANQGIHKMAFDWNLSNLYPSDVTINASSLISFDVICADNPVLEKWKATDRAFEILGGNSQISNFENDRGWYALMVSHLEHGDPTKIDDVTLKSGSLDLINNEYTPLYYEFLNRAEYTPRWVGDTLLQFRPHKHLSTDLVMLEGNTAETCNLLLICEADPSRVVTTPEVSAPPVAQQTTPTVSTQQGQQPQVQQPVKINIGY